MMFQQAVEMLSFVVTRVNRSLKTPVAANATAWLTKDIMLDWMKDNYVCHHLTHVVLIDVCVTLLTACA